MVNTFVVRNDQEYCNVNQVIENRHVNQDLTVLPLGTVTTTLVSRTLVAVLVVFDRRIVMNSLLSNSIVVNLLLVRSLNNVLVRSLNNVEFGALQAGTVYCDAAA